MDRHILVAGLPSVLVCYVPSAFFERARMAQPITGFKIVEVGKPKLGELKPSSVRADIKIHLNVRCAQFNLFFIHILILVI